jgi:hypothetical protein
MKNTKSIQAVTDFRLNRRFFKPHDEYNIKYLINTIYSTFGIESGINVPTDCLKDSNKYDNVMLILLDGLSYSLYEKHLKKLPKEKRLLLERNLLFSKLTTIFPATTTSVIPFLMTGYMPEESGIYEWWQYEHNSDEIICPFLSQYQKDKESLDMKELGVDPIKIYKESRIYKKLMKENIKVTSFAREYETPFNNIANDEINVLTFNYITEYFKHFMKMKIEGRNFFYMYEPNIDYYQHKFGVNSKECSDCVSEILNELYTLLKYVDEKLNGNIRIFITADHGLTDVSYKKILFLDKGVDNIEKYLKKNRKGNPIRCGGSPRACVLHIKEDKVNEFINIARNVVADYGEVFQIDEIFDMGLFDKDLASEDFMRNMGNLIFLAYPNRGIWFEEDFSSYKGFHGGLSEDELHIPLLLY